ncbi:MAG: right-handed parallel beta-helix repeat-containing protein [Terracidiphilus sp.]
MKRSVIQFVACIGIGVLISAEWSGILRAQAPAPSTVTLSPGDDIQSAVNAAPPGTTFVLLAGVYRMQSVKPQNRDTFTGQGNVVLNGSQILTFQLDSSGSGLWVASATASTFNHGSCQKAHPLCGYAQDLFIDNVLQTPVSSSQALPSGSWYFDRAHNTIYLYSNPANHLVELGMTQYAFYGGATGVRISNLTVEKYAAPAQSGAVGGNVISSANGWVVNKVESRWNHGRGISLGGSNSQILNSFIHHNGQLGISLYGSNSQAVNNEISWNNYAGFNAGWEAGGSKFCTTTDLVVKSNYVHDNKGPGLWTDTNNVNTLYDSNTVINNQNEGIVHEVSYNAIIRNNTVKGNGNNSTVWLWNAQIDVQNSSNVEVYGNTVEVPSGGGNGIALINQNRGSGTLGPFVASGNYVHGNTITYLGKSGVSGYVDDTGNPMQPGNHFDSDHYILRNGGTVHWSWRVGKDWAGFQADGQETHGTCCN